MYARTIDVPAEAEPVKLRSGERLPAGLYMLRCSYNPADVEEYGPAKVYTAYSGVGVQSSDCVELQPSEVQLLKLEQDAEIMVGRAEDTKTRVVITEV